MSGCHDAATPSAGLDLVSAGLAGRLVGKGPVADTGLIPSSCAGMGKIYLVANSNPATGLLIEKVTQTQPSCGVRMPSGYPALTTSEISCIQTWANTVTTQ